MDTIEENTEIKIKRLSQRELIFQLIQKVLNGKVREEGVHMSQFLTKDERTVIKNSIKDLIISEVMTYKKDAKDLQKVTRYASLLLCDALKKDKRYN